MVLRDLDGGHISTVSYDSNAPVERTLKSFAINLTGNPSFGAILNQARGEKVEVVLQQTNATQPGTLSGTVVGIEKQKIAVGKDTVEVRVLNLWCADGMRSLKMNEIQRVRFLNPDHGQRVPQGLETLALSHDTQKKAVSINCRRRRQAQCARGLRHREPDLEDELSPGAGQEGRQAVSCKAGPSSRTRPTRTGRTCRMALVSGRPISFQMDLYHAAVRAPSRRRAGTVRFAATPDLQRRLECEPRFGCCDAAGPGKRQGVEGPARESARSFEDGGRPSG